MLELGTIVAKFAEAFKSVDASGVTQPPYRAGIGPFGEPAGINHALGYLKATYPSDFATARPKPYPGSRRACDVVIDGKWALEFKLIRPFGDNGKEAEHWSENVLHPYPGNTSTIGDCLKLANSGFHERKGVVVYGFEHSPPVIPLETAVRSFETLAREVVGISLGPRYESTFTELIHPIHQKGRIYAWEVMEAGQAERESADND